MNPVDKYLYQIQEDKLQEIDPVTGTLVVGSTIVIAHLIFILKGVSEIESSIKINKPLTQKINGVLNSGNKWIIHIYSDIYPNAFSIGFGRHIFITTSLMKILSEKEIIAVLLHEIYHSTKKHTIKGFAYKYPFFYLVSFVGVSVFAGTITSFILAIISMFLADQVGGIVYNIAFSKKMEYNADSYATKQGYGKELIGALTKIRKFATVNSKNQKCGKMCQLINKVDQAIDEHPEMKKRIENILKQSDKLYKTLKTRSFGKIKDFVTKAWEK